MNAISHLFGDHHICDSAGARVYGHELALAGAQEP